MKIDRIKQLESFIGKEKSVSLDLLCENFNVSKSTIRRDIDILEEKGLLKKVYGGVISTSQSNTTPFIKRQSQNPVEKSKIGFLASNLIKDGDVIFIDSGSTTAHILPNLRNKKNITLITNCLNIMYEATQYENIVLIATGGILQRKTNSFTSIDAIDFIKDININKAFMATTGISIDKGVTNTSYLETEIKKVVVEYSDSTILLADDSKLDVVALMQYCELDEIDLFVTNQSPPEKYLDFFDKNNIEIIW